MMSDTFDIKIGDGAMFQDLERSAKWGSSLLVEEHGKVAMYADASTDERSFMSCHTSLELVTRSEVWSNEQQRDVTEYNELALFMKMMSSAYPSTESEFRCEDTVLYLWDSDNKGDNVEEEDEENIPPLNPTFGSSASFSPDIDNDGVVDIRIYGCGETVGESHIYVDQEDEGKIEVLDENFLPEVLKTVEIEDMSAVATLVTSEEDSLAAVGTIPAGMCDSPSGCFSGRSCDDIINTFMHSVGVELPTCTTLTRDGCDCGGCMCAEGVGDSCEVVEMPCGAGNEHLVCKNWPTGRLYVTPEEELTIHTSSRRKLFGTFNPVGSVRMCVPPDWV